MTEPLRGLFLAIETSTRTARVGLSSSDGSVLVEASNTADRHAANLLGLCDQLFRSQGISAAQLGAIVCGAGPGSFTGLRVGMSMAKGLALPFTTPLVLVSSLHSLALDLAAHPNLQEVNSWLACLDAGKGELHAQEFGYVADGTFAALAEPNRLRPEALFERIRERSGTFVGVGGPALEKFLGLGLLGSLPGCRFVPNVEGPSVRAVTQLGVEAHHRGDTTDIGAAAPTYGRLPDITAPKRKTVGDAPSS